MIGLNNRLSRRALIGGLVAAPVIYAWIKAELQAKELI